MSLEPDATTGSLFCASTGLPEKPARSVLPHAHPRDPVFVSPRNFFRFSWLELLGSLFQHDRPESTNEALDLFRQIPLLDRRIVVTPLTIALAIHLLAIPLLSFFLHVVPQGMVGRSCSSTTSCTITSPGSTSRQRSHVCRRKATGAIEVRTRPSTEFLRPVRRGLWGPSSRFHTLECQTTTTRPFFSRKRRRI